MKRTRLLALILAALFLLSLPVAGLAYVGSWQAGENGYVFVSGDANAPKALCQKVEIQGGVFYHDPATGNYYDKYSQNVTYTVYSGESKAEIPSAEGPITLQETAFVAFSNGKCTLGYKTGGQETYAAPEDLMSAMGRIDFLIFIADIPAAKKCHHHHHHHHGNPS